jgi:N-acyl-D-amino-acid deacylase
MLGLVEDARREGLDVTFDSYPYEWASTRLLIMLPTWVQSGGPEPLKERLTDAAIRERYVTRSGSVASRTPDGVRGTTYGSATSREPRTSNGRGKTLGEYMEATGSDVVDAICDLLLAEDLRVNEVTPGPWTETLPRFVAHPLGMIGTDSTFIGAKPSPRTYGSFPRVLGEFVRDRRHLTLPEAVRKMTSYPAQRLGILDRGILRDGLKPTSWSSTPTPSGRSPRTTSHAATRPGSRTSS